MEASGPRKCSKSTCKTILEPGYIHKTCPKHLAEAKAHYDKKKVNKENVPTPIQVFGPSSGHPSMLPGASDAQSAPLGLTNGSQQKRKLAGYLADATNTSLQTSKEPRVRLDALFRVCGRQPMLIHLWQRAPTAEIFENENSLFRAIQSQFSSNGSRVSYSGQYTLPEHNGQNVATHEWLQKRYQKDKLRIQSIVERMWRMTGYRFTCVPSLTETKHQFSIE